MSTPLITVEGLSKAYRIGLKDEIPDTFMGALTGWLQSPLRNLNRLRRLNTFHKEVATARSAGNRSQQGSMAAPDDGGLSTDIETDIVWALQDISFEINQGEVVGVIGHNGAGKSTLLKVLSRITDPTTGRAVIRGRVSSLLEVGTGFHAELTGRENVYMNGTILGMTKREIDRKFDDIVEFSGVNKFLDTPVKRYSSGMKVRLAFAVAAHLDPEILIIDEVLAVGDAGFQRKCIGKMQDVAQSGRTVLFVSHNAVALRSLCQRGILLQGGRSVMDGPLPEVLDFYLSSLNSVAAQEDLATRTDRGGKGDFRVQAIEIRDEQDVAINTVATGQPTTVAVQISDSVNCPQCALRVYDDKGHFITQFDSRLNSLEDDLPNVSTDVIRCSVPEVLLMPGHYRVDVELFAEGVRQDQVKAACAIEVISGRLHGRPLKDRNNLPSIAHPHRWVYQTPCQKEA
ncbi:Teichoic acids export ATP-binding protein TagH [Stieleria maiorica]|uniref:Teichoic acids export ATP-binding protein TagH n=1 Tax=Stieleria maiorica TaxID=2795974 RepID=A0A5B9MED8_9BACT|nr:ABC transporter ATP-binding protein [Stieleria maiorica]QEF99641.1 Teichoic acids export ATP-binding protein TagH [Stieleria maiorica]